MKNLLILLLFFVFSSTIKSQQLQTKQIDNSVVFEVTSTILRDGTIICVYMERRANSPIKKIAKDLRVSYLISKDNGKTWTYKQIIENPKAMVIGNPYIYSDTNGKTYLVVMNVFPNFFDSNLTLYEFDTATNKFMFKSIPVSSKNKLIDKPSLTQIKNKLYLSFIEYNKRLNSSSFKIHSSSDFGKSWVLEKRIDKKNENLQLGQSMVSDKKSLYASIGSYWNKNIYLTRCAF